MLKHERILVVIPARGGSKRIPRKNIRLFDGQPLIAWSIYAARQSKHIDRIVVSTEDDEIRRVAHKLGAEVIDRPAHLATDTASSEDVMRHVLYELPKYAMIVLLQPTSPYRSPEDIDACIEICSVCDACISVGLDGQTNGAVYVAYSGWLLQGNNFSDGRRIAKYQMPPERSLDIDTEDQWHD